jgi:HlyD family secretion protein
LAIAALVGCKDPDPGYYQGYVEGEYVYVGSSVAGVLQVLEVAKGQTVAKGAPLFQLDPNPQVLQVAEANRRMERARAQVADLGQGSRPSELAAIEARLDKARASLALAQGDLGRREELFQEGNTDAISLEELESAQADVAIRRAEVGAIEAEHETARLGGRSDAVVAAQKEVESLAAFAQQMTWQLEEKSVVAPQAGFIQDTLFSEGEFVPAGRPAVSLLPPGNLKIRFFVPQSLLPSLQVGRSVEVRFDGMDSSFSGEISFIAPEAEFTPPVIYSKESRVTLVFMVEALPEGRALEYLRPGQPLEVYLN